MGRLTYADPVAEATFNDNDVRRKAQKNLSDLMAVDNYTKGVVSGKAAAESQSIDEIVRKKRD